jgi:hypothetical protein
LGLQTNCLGVNYVGELNLLNQIHQELLTNPTYKVSGPAVWRFVMALSDEHGLGIQGDSVWRTKAEPRFLPVRRFREAFDRSTQSPPPLFSYPWLEGRSITFSGIHPSVLGNTAIQNKKTGNEILIAKNIDVLLVNTGYKYVYLPHDLHNEYPSWKKTGRKFGTHEIFFEYMWSPPPPPVVTSSLRLGQIHNGNRHFSLTLFPVLDTSILTDPLCPTPSTFSTSFGAPILYSVVLKEGLPTLVPYSFDRWRCSIWVSDKDWGPLGCTTFILMPPCDLLFGSCPLPWDITPDEVKKYDSEPTQLYLRDMFRDRVKLTDTDLVQLHGKKTLKRVIIDQREFTVFRSQGGFFLRLSSEAIWSGTCVPDLKRAYLVAVKKRAPNTYIEALMSFSQTD